MFSPVFAMFLPFLSFFSCSLCFFFQGCDDILKSALFLRAQKDGGHSSLIIGGASAIVQVDALVNAQREQDSRTMKAVLTVVESCVLKTHSAIITDHFN